MSPKVLAAFALLLLCTPAWAQSNRAACPITASQAAAIDYKPAAAACKVGCRLGRHGCSGAIASPPPPAHPCWCSHQPNSSTHASSPPSPTAADWIVQGPALQRVHLRPDQRLCTGADGKRRQHCRPHSSRRHRRHHVLHQRRPGAHHARRDQSEHIDGDPAVQCRPSLPRRPGSRRHRALIAHVHSSPTGG